MTILSVFSLMGGVALFLYGMHIMGGGLEKLAGGKTQAILQKLTSSTLKGVLLGTVITALIQSSSGTTVIIIGLVNSGIMTLTQALGVIMGANIGTTVTGQLLRLADLSGGNIFMQLLQPKNFAPLLAFAGVVLLLFFKSKKTKNLGQILVGFGTLFIGMFLMEDALRPLREAAWFGELFASLSNPVLGILVGTLITAVIQSSSASVGILQALSTTGAVTWGNAIPIILGQNIGTTSTGLIASTGASKAAKRVAFVHLYFNIIGSALFIALIYLGKAIFGFEWWNNAIGRGDIANFHTLFNVVVTFVFIPFSRVLVWLAERTVPDKPGTAHPELEATVLDERLYTSPAVAVSQARKALEQMIRLARLNQGEAMDILLHYQEDNINLAQQRESLIDRLDVGVTNYLVRMNDLDLSENESRDVTALLHAVTEFERIGDYVINIVERSGEVFDKQVVFSGGAQRELDVLDSAISEILDITIDAFTHGDLLTAARVEPLEETIDLLCETMRARHIDRVKHGQCSIEAGVIFLEVLTDYERVGDHCSNVAARMIADESENLDVHALRRSLHEGGAEQYNRLAESYREKYYGQIVEGSLPS